MKTYKYILIPIITILIIVVVFLFYFNLNTPKKATEINNPTQITIGFWYADQLLKNDNLQQFIENKFNVKFAPIRISELNWNEDLQKLAIKNELPDIFVNDLAGTSLEEDWAENGIVQRISRDLEAYPNLTEYLSDPYIDMLCAKDGDLYSIPRKRCEDDAQIGFMRCVLLRKDIIEQYGWQTPTSYEEFYTLLQNFYAQRESEGVKAIPLVTENTSKLEAIFLGLFPELSNLERGWVLENNLYIPAYVSKNMPDALKVINTLYKENLLDQNFIYRSTKSAEELFITGQSIAICLPYFRLSQDYRNINEQFSMTDSVAVMRPWAVNDGNIYRFYTTNHWSELYINRNVDSQKREKILSILDYLISDEFTKDIKNNNFQNENSLNLFSDLININVSFKYRNADVFTESYTDEEYNYIKTETDWYRQNTQIIDFPWEIAFYNLPYSNALPNNQKVHEELAKIILSNNADEAWSLFIDNLYNEYPLTLAVEEVNNKYFSK